MSEREGERERDRAGIADAVAEPRCSSCRAALSLRGIEKFSSYFFLVPRGTGGDPLFIVPRPWHEITSPEANAHDDHLLAFRPTFLSFVRHTAALYLPGRRLFARFTLLPSPLSVKVTMGRNDSLARQIPRNNFNLDGVRKSSKVIEDCTFANR